MDNNKYIFRQNSKRKVTIVITTFIVSILLMLVNYAANRPSYKSDGLEFYLYSIVAIIIILSDFYFSVELLLKKPVITFDNEGIHYRSIFRNLFINWVDVQEVLFLSKMNELNMRIKFLKDGDIKSKDISMRFFEENIPQFKKLISHYTHNRVEANTIF